MKLKSLLFTLLLLAGFSMAKARIVEIGSSANSSTFNYLPTQINYNYSISQQVYRYFEVRDVSTINSISFYNNASSSTTRTINLYLNSISKSSFSSNSSWVPVTNENLYFSGSVTFQAGGWTTITLDRQFTHGTNQDIVVTMDDNTGTYTSSLPFAVGKDSFEGYKSLYNYSDTKNYDPLNFYDASNVAQFTGTQSYYRNQIRFNGAEKIYGLPSVPALPALTNWKYVMSEQIYTVAEIGDKGFINSVALKNIGTEQTRDIDVYLVNTSKAAFSSETDWVTVSESNKVFSGQVTFAKDEWTQIKFQEPRYYNGTSNLAFFVYDHTGSYYQLTTFAGYEGDGTQSLAKWNDNEAYDVTNLSSMSGTLISMKNQIQFEFDDDLYIGDGGSSTFSYLPTNTYYNYSLSQQIYTKEEIGGAKDLTSISFFNVTAAERVRNLNIYLVPTYADKFDNGDSWIPFSESNLVFSGDVTFYEEDWTTIPFDNTYSFNGATNLAVVVADNTGSYLSNSLYFRVFTASQQALSYCADNGYETAESMTSVAGSVRSQKNQIKFNAVDTDPARPENLHAEDIQPYQATIVWEGSADTWQFQYKRPGDSDWTEYMITSNSYTMTGLLPLSKYYVRVKALFDDGTSSKWTPTEFTTIYTTPTDLAATTTPTTATLNWTGYGEEYDVMYVNLEKYNQIFFEDFEGGFGSNGWTTIANGPTPVTNGWELSPTYNSYTNYSYCFSGFNSPTSYSWIDSPATAYNADNWLISPLVDLKGTLSFWIYTNSTNEQYEVKLSTSGTAVSDFVFTLRPMAAAGGTYWQEVRIDLSDYEGEQGHIAIHHQYYNGYDLRIDDFCIFEGEMGYVHSTGTEATIEGLEPNTEYVCYVLSHKKGEGSVQSEFLAFTTLANNPAPFDLAATADLTSADISWDGFSDSYKVQYRIPAERAATDNVLFFEDFENGFEDKGWTIYTEGQKATSAEAGWMIRTITENVEDWNIPSGNSFAYAQSYDNDEGTFNADNWLVSPQLDLRGILKFWERAQDSGWPDRYEVLLSTKGNKIADFTEVLRPMGPSSSDGWKEVEIDLKAYEGKQGYIAIHHVDYDKFWLDIDDFGLYEAVETVPAGEWQETEVTTDKYITIEGLEKGTKYEYQVIGMKEGEEDAVSESAYFTTIAPVDLVLYTNGDNGSAIYNNDGLYTNVTIQGRTFKNDGKWWSICLPFDLELEGSILEGSDLRQPEDFKEVDTYLVIDCLTPLTKIEAGKPYMIKYNGAEDIVDPVFEDVVVKYGSSHISLNSDKVKFYPIYNYGYLTSSVDNYYVMDGNLRLGRMNLQKNMGIPAFDCYFWVDETYNSGLDGIGLNFGDIDLFDLITGVEKVESSEEPANIYNVAGQRLSKKQKGINIIGDKKVLVK